MREYDGFLLDDPIWPGSLIAMIDRTKYYRCVDCSVMARRGDYLPMFKTGAQIRADGYDTRKECPFCFRPGYVGIDYVEVKRPG